MLAKRRIYIIISILALVGCAAFATVALLPHDKLPPQDTPPSPPPNSIFYQILDIEDEQTLMYVPVAVKVGDELITDTNKRYQVVKVEENRAYARFIETVNLEKYVPKLK